MPEKIRGLLGNHLFQVAAMIGTGKQWALTPSWETPLEGTLAPEALLVHAETCPSIWNAARYLNGPIPLKARAADDELLPLGYYLNEKHWRHHEAEVKRILGYTPETAAEAASFVGPDACAIHLRRGEKRLCQHKYGFSFPITYIKTALARVPKSVRKLVFSDEPEWALLMLRSIGIEAENGETGIVHPIQAMARISACRWIVGSNSTFSWWGAYLNTRRDKCIYMPGWRRIDFSNNEQITEAWPPTSERRKWHLLNPTRKLAVIVAAYQAEHFILDCLQGFASQLPLQGWKYEIRIGVDGCPETAAALDRLGVPYWFSRENVGAYVTRNSLIAQGGPAEAYCVFDADDVPMPDYCRRSIANLYHTGITTCSRLEVGEHLEDIGEKTYARSYGRAMFQHEVWAAAGSFRPDRCDSDGDFIWRVQDMGYKVTFTPPPFLMLRRQHPRQLTRDPLTALRSPYRVEIQNRHKELRLTGERHVEPITVRMQYRKGDWTGIPVCMPDSQALTMRLVTEPIKITKTQDSSSPIYYVKTKKKVVRKKRHSGNNPAITREER